MWAQSGSALRRSPCRRPLPAYSIASNTRSVSVAGSGQPSSAAAARSRVSATVLRGRLSDRAICRSLAPPCFRRRISRTRRIDTLSAGIGSPLVVPDEQSAVHRPAVEHLPPLTGVADFRSEWPRSNRNQWPTSFRNRRPTSPEIRNGDGIAPIPPDANVALQRGPIPHPVRQIAAEGAQLNLGHVQPGA